MGIHVTIDADNAEEFRYLLSGFVASVNGGSIPTPVLNVADSKAPATAQPRSRKAVETVTPAAEQATKEPANEDDQAHEDSDVVVTLEQIRAKATEVSQTGKQPEVKALLLKFEAKSISTIPEEQRSAFLKALEAL